MIFAPDLSSVTHGIQLAVAPVFLLTAVSGMIGAVAGRLARIVDRARYLETRLESELPDEIRSRRMWDELDELRQRGGLVNGCLALLTFCAFLIGITIILLFLGETSELPTLKIATICFLSGVLSFLLALLFFLGETVLATRMLKFGTRGVAAVSRQSSAPASPE